MRIRKIIIPNFSIQSFGNQVGWTNIPYDTLQSKPVLKEFTKKNMLTLMRKRLQELNKFRTGCIK